MWMGSVSGRIESSKRGAGLLEVFFACTRMHARVHAFIRPTAAVHIDRGYCCNVYTYVCTHGSQGAHEIECLTARVDVQGADGG